MAGPWISGKDDGEYVESNPWCAGDVVEYDTKMPGGDVVQAIMVITSLAARRRNVMGHFITASDKQYIIWMAEDKSHSNPGLYRQYAVKGDERDAKKTMVIYRARFISRADEPVLLSPIKWRKTRYSSTPSRRRGREDQGQGRPGRAYYRLHPPASQQGGGGPQKSKGQC